MGLQVKFLLLQSKISTGQRNKKILNHGESSDDTVIAHALKVFSRYSAKSGGTIASFFVFYFLIRKTSVLQKRRHWPIPSWMKISVGQTRTKCRQFSPFLDSKAATHWLKKPFTASNFAQMEVTALSSIPSQPRAVCGSPVSKLCSPWRRKAVWWEGLQGNIHITSATKWGRAGTRAR